MRDLRRNVRSDFVTDEKGNPTGGFSAIHSSPPDVTTDPQHVIIEIPWQNGVLSTGRSGVVVEEMLEAALQRLQYFNESKFRCRENSLAITKIEEALSWLDVRQRNRELQGVEDSYEKHAS